MRRTVTALALAAIVCVPALAAEPKGHPVAIEDEEMSREEAKEHDRAVRKLVYELEREKNKVMLLSRIELMGGSGGTVERDALMLFCRGSKNQEHLTGAFKALAKIGGPRVLNFLCGKHALKSRSDWVVQRAAADALVELGDARCACCLIDVIEDRRQKTKVQAACLIALSRVASTDEKAVKTIFKCAEAKDDMLRCDAMTALGYLHTRESFEKLADAARTENNGQVRGYACTALGIHGNRDGIEVLREVIANDKALQVKDAAMKALKKLGASD